MKELRLPIDGLPEYIAINKFNGTEINNILIKNTYELGSWIELHKIADKFFIVLKDKIYEMSEDGTLKLFLAKELTNFNFGLWGTNKNNLFLSMWDGIAHYNGNDIKYIYYYPNNEQVRLKKALFFDDEIFFVGESHMYYINYVFRAKLINN